MIEIKFLDTSADLIISMIQYVCMDVSKNFRIIILFITLFSKELRKNSDIKSFQ